MTPVRVRYAPSPTGAPHVGNIRTALFDWLFARHTGGTFILRIEDTDQTRSVADAVEQTLDALRWLGLDWDEGVDVGGPHAPYVQSQRLDRYEAAARMLISSGHAYECYCSQERLDRVRDEMRAAKKPPRYDGRCRTDEGRRSAQSEADSGPAVVRFKMPDTGTTTVPDFIRGEVTFENALQDDFIILKSDGFPTYHLAMAVDDHEMRISHVIRGEEWLPSAPKHKLLFAALGHDLPVLIHTPVILGPDRSKLSKRHGAQSVLEYREMGYLPDAVLNFLGLLGWSLDDHTEIISRQQFVENFSLERLIKSPAVFNIEKLDWMNGVYMRQMPERDLALLLKDWLEKPEDEGGLPSHIERPIDLEYLQGIVPYVRERVKLLPQARDMMQFFFEPDGIELDERTLLGKALAEDKTKAWTALSAALVKAEELKTWDIASLNGAFLDMHGDLGLKRGDFLMLVRLAVTGRSVSPPLMESMEILGRDRCVLRLRDALNLL
jgi:glutamyl-tRNA synthetase